MQEFLVELTEEDLEFLGTEKPGEVEAVLALLAEVAISETAMSAVFSPPITPLEDR